MKLWGKSDYFNFHIVIFPFICSSSTGITSIYLLVILELVVPIIISVNKGYYLSHGFPVVKLKSSLRKLYGRHHDFFDRYGICVSKWPRLCSFYRIHHNPVLSSFMTYHGILIKYNITRATKEQECLPFRSIFHLCALVGFVY
jgi:hypothetical protein